MPDEYIPEPIYNLDSAAKRCGVSRETVAEWVRERGMRAFPLGKADYYRHRDYLILDRWLIEFLQSHSVAGRRDSSDEIDPIASTKRGYRGPRSSPLGPCPV